MRKQSQHHSSSSRSQLPSSQRNVCDRSTKTLSVNYKSDPKVGSRVKIHVHTHTRETAGSIGCLHTTCSDVCRLKIGKDRSLTFWCVHAETDPVDPLLH